VTKFTSYGRRLREPCPNCGEDLEWDEVDVGVGMVTSPAWCTGCDYSEDNPYGGYDERMYPPQGLRTDDIESVAADGKFHLSTEVPLEWSQPWPE
jgi:hypothetical protein